MNLRKYVIAGVSLATVAFMGALGLSPLFPPTPAQSASVVLCAPELAVGAAGPRRMTNPNTGGGTYTTNGQGCAAVAAGDVGYFLSQGFTGGQGIGQIAANGITANNFGSLVLPAFSIIRDIVIQNTTTNAVGGNVQFGTTSGASDVAFSIVCASSCLTFVSDGGLLKRVFSAAQTIAVSTPPAANGGSFNGASLNVTIVYETYGP